MTVVRVLLVDDHPIVRAGPRSLFVSQDAVDVVGEAASGEEAVALAERLRPDVVLCDLRMGDGMDGVQTTAALRALDHAPAVIILTTFDRDAEVLGAIEAGAAGYLLKDAAPDVIARSIRQAASGQMVLSAELSQRVGEVLRTPRVAADRTGTRGAAAAGCRRHQPADRPGVVCQRGDREDSPGAPVRQARRAEPVARGGGGPRYRAAVNRCGSLQSQPFG